MHIYFSGIGGSGIGSTALLAQQAGYDVSGSDKQDGATIALLRQHGITDVTIGQSYEDIARAHKHNPIDWFVYTSALAMEQSQDAPELRFCREHNIRTSKRDEFLTMLLEQKQQKLLAAAGTHGKSTTTAMLVWLYKQLGLPASYALGAKVGFGDPSHFDSAAEHFLYECDEFDRNFLAFHPFVSGITGLSWDHHEIFPSLDNYNQAFRDFIAQSKHTILWQSDADALGLQASDTITILNPSDPTIAQVKLAGRFNRQDAWIAMHMVAHATGTAVAELMPHINSFPGLSQRMEQLAPNLYTNYAHTPEKIAGGLSTAQELAAPTGQKIVVIYEPLTNRRQHYIQDQYKDTFAGVDKLYWVPTYLAREDPNQPVLTPTQLITNLRDPSLAQPAQLDDELLHAIQQHLQQGDLVVAMGASGAGSLDDWLRKHFGAKQ